MEEPFFPVRTSSSPILRNLDGGLPQLLGYNGTTAKSAAQTVLVTARDDPLLAQWQYGLGRSVAWTSDATGKWAKSWIAWPGFSKFFSQLVGWTFPGEESGGSQVAPGVYEAPVASLSSGAYAVRVTQTKPGETALGRTLGLVAPTAAEYRLLGANQPLLSAIRAATGGTELAAPAAARVLCDTRT